ncbi:tripeptidyl peptidase I [Thecamonas trahens ATCC 50062]|uniref:Tripeptidyl peptidase I n=1 Tax=Thecamonas trahens ATCC 50062 TaxID=461836 RepID=A0A0L0D2V7_THETB|nr:tripeptidyl peptidase I [Thecamonas trahens ATCC 50062]KNC46652.1 tripeptidyl peptidase I [Thecamonas trahens ATCC 50062]|eukprot:XP_013760425.1 tripeptidyl peptidase I [Thecamonas trahens ATCC 50062]
MHLRLSTVAAVLALAVFALSAPATAAVADSHSVLVLLTHSPAQRSALHAAALYAFGSHPYRSASGLAKLVGSPKATIAAVSGALAAKAPSARVVVLPSEDAILVSGLDAPTAAALAATAEPTAPMHAPAVLHPAIEAAFVIHGEADPTARAQALPEVEATGAATGAGAGDASGVPPQLQRELLGIDASVRGPGASGVPVMVWGPGTFGYLASDLQQYYSQWGVNNSVSLLSHHGADGTPGGDNFGEGTLDTTQSSAIGLGVPIWVTNTNTSSANEEGPGFGYAFLGFSTMLAAADESKLPGVLSMSLGSISFEACSRMCETLVAKHPIFSLDSCNEFVRFKQRQVCMFPSAAVADRIEAELAKITLRGVSMVAASGDGGSHFSFQPFDRLSLIGDALNKIACATNSPTYPASSAYVLGVGGLNPPASASSSSQPSWPASGGGFSWIIPRPAYQDAAVKAYLANSDLPPATAFNASGRAYPDVAVLGNDVPMVIQGSAVVSGGTSASAPAMGGFMSLIVNARAAAGKSNSGRLGLLPALVYSLDAAHPGELFDEPTDNGSASSACTSAGFCCPIDSSFRAANGFDPITGLGRPVFPAWLKYMSEA